MKKNIIITAANLRCGDFIINHWLKSLLENVNLKNIDVLVIDYGLTNLHKRLLIEKGIIVFKGSNGNHIVNKRFIDSGQFLKNNKYEQVLFIDGCDIIFQEDISSLFKKNKDSFRIITLGDNIVYYKWLLFGTFRSNIKKIIWKVIKNKPMINAGVIFAPSKKFIILCNKMNELIANKNFFGPDQVIVNYFLYQEKTKFLDKKYNFMINVFYEGFKIIDKIFYKKNGEKIAIVHNSGQTKLFRPIKNFGYKNKSSKLKPIIYFLKTLQYRFLSAYNQLIN